MLTRDAILGIKDLSPMKVHVTEWAMDVFVRPLTGSERDAFEAEIVSAGTKRMANMRGKLAARSLCDASGNRLFTDDDAEILGAKSAAALDRIITAIQQLNALGDKEVKQLGEVSTDTPSAASGLP